MNLDEISLADTVVVWDTSLGEKSYCPKKLKDVQDMFFFLAEDIITNWDRMWLVMIHEGEEHVEGLDIFGTMGSTKHVFQTRYRGEIKITRWR